ncbi:MAG: MFS transporter [Alcaligenaceae bacterium]|nr:MFS transporter [Alcaligenaceae bacterium]
MANLSSSSKDISALSPSVQRANIVRLTVAQALAGANTTVIFATGSIVGNALAPDKSLATLPITIFVIGMASGILPTGAIARRYGRRTSFLVGTSCGVITGLLATLAVLMSSFWLYCLATFFGGAYTAVVLSFRFAAADGVEAAKKARALSFVMGGGVVAGIVGAQLVTHTMHLWSSYMFAATYIAQAAVAALSALVLMGIKLPMPTVEEVTGGGRPLSLIIRQPLFITAVICGAVSYSLMNFLMTAAPLAMKMGGHSQESSNLGLQWHVIAMYAPSFFTGRLIARYGVGNIVMFGLLLTGLSIVVGLMGGELFHFWTSLILLGVGWNFGFIGASAMVLECHTPEEKTRVQSFNDFIVFGTMAIGSFVSGSLLTYYNWGTVLWVSFAPLVLAVVVLSMMMLRGKTRAAIG